MTETKHNVLASGADLTGPELPLVSDALGASRWSLPVRAPPAGVAPAAARAENAFSR
jgi:hypothetical protein